MFLEMKVPAPRHPIPMSGDHVSSADDTRKNCSLDHRLKCDPGITKGTLWMGYEPDWSKEKKICYGQLISDGQTD